MGAVALALATWGAWSRYATWVEVRKIRSRLDTISKDLAGIGGQVRKVISMLGWGDDHLKTQVIDPKLKALAEKWRSRKKKE